MTGNNIFAQYYTCLWINNQKKLELIIKSSDTVCHSAYYTTYYSFIDEMYVVT